VSLVVIIPSAGVAGNHIEGRYKLTGDLIAFLLGYEAIRIGVPA
jgi:hypothetical protein